MSPVFRGWIVTPTPYGLAVETIMDEDEPSPLAPYFWQPNCDCHTQDEAIAAIYQAVQDGLMTPDEATEFVLGKLLLEHTSGQSQLTQLTQEIAHAETEQVKHAPGSYYYNLIAQDLQNKQVQLRKYEEESKHSEVPVQLFDLYQQNVLSFLDFLSVMKGKYHEATFKERRNALDVLGVTVQVSAPLAVSPGVTQVETDKDWLSLVEAGALCGIDPKIPSYRASRGEFVTVKREESHRCTYVHRNELNRFLSNFTLRPRRGRDDIQPRVEINYSPIFSGVQSSLTYISVSIRAFKAG